MINNIFRMIRFFLLILVFVPVFSGAEPSVTTLFTGVDLESDSKVDAADTPPAPPPPELASARASLQTFLIAMSSITKEDQAALDTAVLTLDLSNVNPMVRVERGRDIAWTLYEIMQRHGKVNPLKAPTRSEGDPWVVASFKKGSIVLARQDDGRWLFDGESLSGLDDIIAELPETALSKALGSKQYLPWNLRFRTILPEQFRNRAFLLENWKWIGLLLMIAAGVIVDRIVRVIMRRAVRQWKKKTPDDTLNLGAVPDELLRPAGLIVMAAIWWIGINLLALPESVLLILLVAVKFLAGAAGVWSAYRLVDLLGAWMLGKASRSDNKVDDALYPLLIRTFKIFVTVVGFVFVASNLNINVSGLLAGLGLGGLAFALAAKDMVQNLFGSATVLMDRTFTVGDWILVGDIEGTVERIGFRSTRVRTFYNSVVTVPNSKFIIADVDNMGERRFRRMKTVLSVTYQTPPDRIDAFCEAVRELIRLHPYMRKDYFHVYFNQYAASSLDILVYVFWEAPDWGTELRERHRFLLDILRVASTLGVEFAYPTQTLFMANESEQSRPAPIDNADELGRQAARAAVDESTGRNVRPPPVTF